MARGHTEYRLLAGKPERKRERPFGTPRIRWDFNIKTVLKDTGKARTVFG